MIISMFHATNIMTLIGFLLGVRHRLAYYHTLTTPILLDLHLKKPDLKMRYQIFRKTIVYKLATKILPVSQAASLDAQKYFHVPVQKCIVFMNALEDPILKDPTLQEIIPQPNTVRCFARLDPCKGIDILLRAWLLAIEKIPNAHLEIYGTGDPTTVLKAAGLEKLPNNVQFPGAVRPNEVRRLMRAATLTVLPSRSEAFGFSVLESMSVGTPVIASKVGGVPDIISDGIDSFLFESENPIELANKIVELINDPKLREMIGEKAREKFEKSFSLDQVAIEQAETLEKMIIS